MEDSVGAEGLLVGGDDRAMQKEEISGWTEQRVALLKKLWGDGIVGEPHCRDPWRGHAQLGDRQSPSFGAIRAIPWRGRGTSRSRGSAPKRSARKSRCWWRSPPATATPLSPRSFAMKPNCSRLAEATAEVVPLMQRCSILDLTERKCKWPIGDPVAADFYFCGARTADGLPYCSHHCRMAYQPVAERRRERQASQG